ncbi:SNF-domain-containing protein [Aaosphaeria arxii CBS 175.79]|uniref:SNF-domain-containing protein n=1 Tax=Aaosphaeria arxii CBS 175.79 TaxID=1450172 RepID=A0A6A5YCG3_9PLEO|nr:SNF-domain-containing protein [Aaosphaeria arxii CBS 175.79]KAF2022390.1 SNF-domain-containing protein [Aaosphaeria arxii CBS 175.79]
MNALRKVVRFVAPKAEKSEDGRDQWGSRTSFVLAAMGGAVGLGNILRFPGQVFHNNGLQWFVPYLMALFLLGLPVLILEICIGQAYRGGCLIAYDHISKRTKGVGMAVVFNGYAIVLYYVPILTWVLQFFRHSFRNPLPWTGRGTEFYYDQVIRNPSPEDNGGAYLSYPSYSLLGETTGWCAFTWFIVWLCMFKGVGMLGRVVYITMGLPIVMAVILIGRGCSLDNAGRGVKLYFGEWNGDQLGRGDIWQAACGHIFFSIGVGMGYFTSYASYNSKYANAVQDSFIVAISNSMYEILIAFSVFGVIGFLDIHPDDGVSLGTFSIGFLTYPEALAQMPGSQFWSIVFFFTVFLLGVSSAFALMESIVTMICDTDWGKKIPRTIIASVACFVSFLLSLMYCTEFGFYLLDAADTYINFMCLFFVVWAEIIACTTVYRYRDVVGQIGWPALFTFNFGYFGGTIFGLALAQAVGASAGAGLAFGLFIVGSIVAVFIAKTPDSPAPGFWNKNVFLSRFWWAAFYQGVQLRRDLNLSVAKGKNWKIPVFWGALLRYISAPILAIIFSFAYPLFLTNRRDPLHIFAFSFAHFVMVIIAVGFVLPRWFDVFIPVARRGEGKIDYAPNVSVGQDVVGREVEDGRTHDLDGKTSDETQKIVETENQGRKIEI